MVAAVIGKKQPDEDNFLYFYEFVDFFGSVYFQFK